MPLIISDMMTYEVMEEDAADSLLAQGFQNLVSNQGGLMVSKSVRVNPRHTCPECGSDDVELVRADAAGRPKFIGKLLDLLENQGSRRGQYIMVCHKCGHRSIIFFQ